MIKRLAQKTVVGLLQRHPVVALLGSRQVGKTTLALAIARERASAYLDLEAPSDRAKLADPELYLATQDGKLVILDEIQRMPNLFPVLRGVVDRRRRSGEKTGQFLILGSASVDLLRQSSESLAGRIVYRELTPILADELADPRELNLLWVRGGYPESLLAANETTSREWRDAFVSTYLERDIPQLGPRLPAETLRRFWTMLAHAQGTLLNAARLASALGVSGQTVGRYLDLLVDLLLVRRLPPFASNVGKRLVRSPKVYARDSGLVHALLGLPNLEAILGHPVAGASWEGMVIENVLAAAPAQGTATFYRTAAGAELDLLMEFPGGELWAMEIKRTLSPSPSKGFHIACEDVQATRRYLVYPGAENYEIGHDIRVVPLLDLLRLLRAH